MGLLTRAGYQKLVRDIGEIYEGARRALVRAYWEIGRRIIEEEQRGISRAGYGDRILVDLARDLPRIYGEGSGFSLTNLKRIRKFYLLNPKGPFMDLLPWTHHVELLPVRDPKKRRLIEKRALRENLTSTEVRALVRAAIPNGKHEPEAEKGATSSVPKLLTPMRGRLYTHQIVEKGGALYVDLGFRNHRMLTPAQAAHFGKGDIVEMLADERLRGLSDASAQDLYTYEAELDRVSDGDTQWYFIFTDRREGRGMKHDKLRLRGIDCPELSANAGRAAKKFVEELFSRAVKVTVTTTKPDKFERYLSDIFLEMRDGTEIFLNNELLKHGHARLYTDPKPEDWDD